MTLRLEVRLLHYFTLIVLAASIIAIEFFIEINTPDLVSQICASTADRIINSLPPALIDLRNKIVIMLGILTLVVAIVMMMFIKNISMPLKKMAASAEKINDGDLTEIINIETKDEIGMVGTAINELTSNLQEVAALTSTTSQQAMLDIERIENTIKQSKLPSEQDLNDLKNQIEVLNNFVSAFQLLQTDINK